MKIGEYIELVKQADFTDGNSQWEAATKAPAEAPPVGESVNIDPVQTGAKPIPSSEAGYPPQIKSNNLPKEPWFRMSFEHPDGSKGLEMHIRPRYKLEEVPRFGEGRSWWQYGKDWFNPQKYYEWAKHQWNNKGTNFRNFWKGTYNAPGNQFNALNSNVRPYEFSPLTIGFSVLGPMHEALETIQENATDRAFKDGYVPKDNINLPLGYLFSPDWRYASYYYPELGRELVRETPNIITELLSFNNPTAPLNFAGDIFINPISQALTGKDAVPGLYRPAFSQNRAKSPEEWEALKTRAAANNRKYIVDDILKLNNDAYGYGNWMVDNLAALADPPMQTGGWLIDLAGDPNVPSPIPRIAKQLMGNPKSTYEHNMSSLAKVMDKELQTNVDKYGNKTTDWQALLDFIPGVKSWYDLNGGRPEFRNVPIEQRREMVKPLIEGAIRNGYTKDEIEDAIDLYIDDNSRLYTGANKLQLMAMSPHDVYGQKLLLRNIDTVPKDKYGKPLPRYYQAPPSATFGPSFNRSEKPRYYNNPEWVSANFEIQRMLDDQNTLFKLNPFFKGLVGSQDQLSDEERNLLSNPANLARIQALEAPDISTPDNIAKIPIVQEGNATYEDELRTFMYSHILNKLAQLPVEERYAYLLQSDDEVLKDFLDRYYTNEDTKNKIRKFLFPDRLTPQEAAEQVAPVAKPVGTLTSMLTPALLKARQQARVQQQINDAM